MITGAKLKRLLYRLWTGDDYALDAAQGGDDSSMSGQVKQAIKDAEEQRERSVAVAQKIEEALNGNHT